MSQCRASSGGGNFCINCGRSLGGGQRFCPGCGTEAQPAASPPDQEATSTTDIPIHAGHQGANFSCPFCHTDSPPVMKRKISMAGWAVFVVLLLVDFILSPLAFLCRADYRSCSMCGNQIGFVYIRKQYEDCLRTFSCSMGALFGASRHVAAWLDAGHFSYAADNHIRMSSQRPHPQYLRCRPWRNYRSVSTKPDVPSLRRNLGLPYRHHHQVVFWIHRFGECQTHSSCDSRNDRINYHRQIH